MFGRNLITIPCSSCWLHWGADTKRQEKAPERDCPQPAWGQSDGWLHSQGPAAKSPVECVQCLRWVSSIQMGPALSVGEEGDPISFLAPELTLVALSLCNYLYMLPHASTINAHLKPVQLCLNITRSILGQEKDNTVIPKDCRKCAKHCGSSHALGVTLHRMCNLHVLMCYQIIIVNIHHAKFPLFCIFQSHRFHLERLFL